MADYPRVLVAMPERFGLPRIPSDRVVCVRCGASVWISKRAMLRPADTVVCVVCAMAIVKPGDQIEAAPWVVDDLAEALKMPE